MHSYVHTIQNCNNLTNEKNFNCQAARTKNRKSFIAADYYFIFLNLASPQGRALLNTYAPSTRTRVNIFTCEYFHGFKNYRVHTLPFSYRFRLSTRTRLNLKTMIKYIKRMRGRRDEPAKTCT